MADFLATYNAVIVFIAVNGVLAYSMYAVLIAGQLSLAQAAFASIAAYSSALLSIELGLPFPLVVVAGVSAGAVAAALLGLPVMRLRGVFLAIATLGFGEMVRILALNLDVTGGAQGLRAIPKVVTIWQAWLALAICAWFFARLRPSRLGRGLAALREDETAAEAMGIDVVAYKMFAFVVSGSMAGLSGVLFAHFTRFIAPGQFGFTRAVDALLYAIVGGTAHWLGPFLGGGFLTFLPELQRELGVEAGWLRPFANGLILLAVILFLPSGLAGLGQRLHLLRRRRDAAPRPVPAEDQDAKPAWTATGSPEAAGPDGRAVATLAGVDKDYGGVRALEGVDLRIAQGEVLGLIGPNGAGKTTLVNLLTGLTGATAGSIEVLGDPVDGLRPHQITARGVSRTFQHVKLFEHLSVRENVLVGGHRVTRPTFLRRLFLVPSAGRLERDDAARASRCLAMVGLADRAGDDAGSLSYGDRRRLEIARALCAEPQLLVLDEPAAGMNHVEAAALGDLVGSIAARGVTVLLIEHNVPLVMRACTRVVVLDFGKVIADGDPTTVARDPAVVQAYLGTAADESAAGDAPAAAPAGDRGPASEPGP